MKKKILFLMAQLHGGGAEKVLIDILKRFDYTKYEVDLCLLYNEGIYIDQLPQEVNVTFLYNREYSFFTKMERGFYLRLGVDFFQKKRIKLKLKSKYDVIISFMEGHSLIFHSYIVSQARINISWIHTDIEQIHYTKSYFKNTLQEKISYEKMNRIVFVSEQAKEAFQRVYNIKTEKRVVYNLIDVASIRQLSEENTIPKDKFTVICVGRLSSPKAFDRVIRVASLFKEQGYDLDFWILGSGSLEDDLRALCKEKNVLNNVHFLGFKTNPYVYIKSSDLFLSTSIVEGFSLVVCEALSLGKPIVATKTTGPVEILDNSKYGILCDHDDLSIFTAVKAFVDSPVLCHESGAKANNRANELFCVEKTLNQIYSLFE